MISIVIPNRENENPYQTLRSLASQLDNCEIVIVYDEGKGANWARNRGAELSGGQFLLFSDNDIIWEPSAVETLYTTLVNSRSDIGYSYGWYEMGGGQHCRQLFSQALLYEHNYISTMSMIRKEVFPGFDESIERLQDWDLWLSMLSHGTIGAYCGRKIFTTKKREGITFGDGISWEEAREIVLRKHRLK